MDRTYLVQQRLRDGTRQSAIRTLSCFTARRADVEANRVVQDKLASRRSPIFGLRAALADVAEGRYGVEDTTGRIVEFSSDHIALAHADTMEVIINELIACGYIAECHTDTVTATNGSPVFLLVLTTESLPLFP